MHLTRGKRKIEGLFAALLIILGAAQARADQVIYSDGTNLPSHPFSIGNLPGIGSVFVTDSFVVSAAADLDRVSDIGLSVDTSDGSGAPVSLNWSIGTTEFGTDIASGTATLTTTYLGSLGADNDYFAAFDISVSVGPGTYYLTLSGADPYSTAWSGASGPSTENAYSPDFLGGYYFGSSGANSFTINGTYTDGAAGVPDGTSTALLAVMALGALPLLRRKAA